MSGEVVAVSAQQGISDRVSVHTAGDTLPSRGTGVPPVIVGHQVWCRYQVTAEREGGNAVFPAFLRPSGSIGQGFQRTHFSTRPLLLSLM